MVNLHHKETRLKYFAANQVSVGDYLNHAQTFLCITIFRAHPHPFLAAAAAARMNGFPGPPGFGPPHHPMMGPNPFFRPPFPHGPPNGTDFHQTPGAHPPGLVPPPPHPHFFGPHRPMLTPRQLFMMHQHQQQQQQHQQQQQQHHQNPNFSGNLPPNTNSLPNLQNTISSSNGNTSSVLQDFHQTVVGDIRAGKSK